MIGFFFKITSNVNVPRMIAIVLLHLYNIFLQVNVAKYCNNFKIVKFLIRQSYVGKNICLKIWGDLGAIFEYLLPFRVFFSPAN